MESLVITYGRGSRSPPHIGGFGDLLELHLDYNVTPVTSLDNVSINSYDAFIVSLLLFQRDGEKKFESDLNKLLNTGKSVVLTFDERIDRKTPGLVVSGATPLNMTPMGNIHNVRKINFPKSNTEIEPIEKKEITSLEYLERSYGIKFKKRECNSNIIDRINELFEYINIDIELAYVMNDTQNKFDKFVSLKHTKDYFILKNKNLIIMHDIDANFSYSYRKIDDFKNKFTISDEISNLLTPFFEFLFTYKDKSKTPDWIKDVQFFEEEKILTEIEKINNEITLLQNKKSVVELDLQKISDYKKILYTTGDELVASIKPFLEEMLGIKIADEDVKKEDVSFDLDGKKILCEIKGKNTDITKEYVSQTNSHIIADASKNNVADDDIKNIYKGLLIVNPFIKETLKGKIKKDLYSQEAIRDIKYFKICTIDTLTLLTMYSKFKEDNSSINLKDIILTEDYIKPNFEDII